MTPGESASRHPLRIGLIHRLDARSVLSWSGTSYFMVRALNKHVGEVVHLGPDNSFLTVQLTRMAGRIDRVWKKLTRRNLISDYSKLLSRRTARFYERRIAQSDCDILFAPAASLELSEIQTDLPIVYTSDANFTDLMAYYPDEAPVLESARRRGDMTELAAISRADAVHYPSKWPVKTVREHYGAPAEKIYTFPWGANLEVVPERASALNHPFSGRVNLLLVGVNWSRKGGPIAFECLKTLCDRGVDAHLTVCGCVPPPGFEHPNFRAIPFLSKRDPVQREQIFKLFQEAHFMVLPTRAEAYGIVICESSAYGLPVLVTETGGTGGALKHGVNGFLMPYEAQGPEYADQIQSVISDPAKYQALVRSSRDYYEETLNWDSWAISMRAVMENVLKRAIDPPSQAQGQPLTRTPAAAAASH